MLARLWLLHTDRAGPETLAAGEVLLTGSDRARRERLRGTRLQRDFTLSRWLVRTALSRAFGGNPAAWQLTEGGDSKPRVTAPHPDVDFSLSHTEGLIGVVVARGVDAGLDLETTARALDAAGVAAHFFSPRECDELARCAAGDRARRFLEIWTRKEAYLKARGAGLSLPLDAFSVVPELAFHGLDNDAHRWQLRTIDAGPQHVGAVAFSGACELVHEALPECGDV